MFCSGDFNPQLFEDIVTKLRSASTHGSSEFWTKFASWYPLHLPKWPADGQISRHWSPKEVTHFFTTIRLNPFVVACHLDMDVGTVLTELVKGVLQNLFVLRWALLCPWCTHSAYEAPSLGEIPSGTKCFLCDGDFEADLASNVVITFQVHPTIHNAPSDNLPCPLPLDMQKQYLGEIMVGPTVGKSYEASFADMVVGEYKLCCMLSCRYCNLTVQGEHQIEEQLIELVQPSTADDNEMRPSKIIVRPGRLRIKILNEMPNTITRLFLLMWVLASP